MQQDTPFKTRNLDSNAKNPGSDASSKNRKSKSYGGSPYAGRDNMPLTDNTDTAPFRK